MEAENMQGAFDQKLKEVAILENRIHELEKSKWRTLGTFRITYYGLDITSATASGARPQIGKTIGVDPNVIPYGSIVRIDGKSYIAQDTGSYTGNHIDILLSLIHI